LIFVLLFLLNLVYDVFSFRRRKIFFFEKNLTLLKIFFGFDPFYEAVKSGNLEKVQKLITLRNVSHDEKVRFFHWACEFEHLRLVEFFASWGVDFETRGICLSSACCRGNLELVKYLVFRLGANVKFLGNLPIRNAIAYGNLEVVKYLISVGANVRVDRDSGIQLACTSGQLETLKYLVSLGLNIYTDNNSAIQLASSFNHFEIVRYLVSIGAPVSLISERAKKYIDFCEKMEEKRKLRAQKKIYFWIIPKLYDLKRECGKRLRQKNWEATLKLLES
jgi:ankyrin repeat protein